MNKVRYRVYHSDQDGYRHDRASKRFVFSPEYPFRPLGLIIYESGNSVVEQLMTGMQSQLIQPVPAEVFSPKGLNLAELELLAETTIMQSVLSNIGIPSMAIETVNTGIHLTLVLSEPVGTVAFWGIEVYSKE